MGYSDDLKKSILRMHEMKPYLLVTELAKFTGISKSTIYRWIKDNKNKIPKIKKKCGRKIKLYDLIADDIVKWLEKHNLSALYEIQNYIKEKHNICVCQTTIYKMISIRKISYKNTRQVFEIDPKLERYKKEFIDYVRQEGNKNIMCLDEIGFYLGMYRLKGWSKKGARCYNITKKIRRTHISGIFIIDNDNNVVYKLFKAAINVESFTEFIASFDNKFLMKTILLDNLRVHHNIEFAQNEMNKQFVNIIYTQLIHHNMIRSKHFLVD